jgi:WD40 repeat protein
MLLASAGFLAGPFLLSASLRGKATASGEPAATLSSLTGEVWLTSVGQKSLKATSAQSVYPGDRVRVGEDSAAELTLADGSRIDLRARSVLHFARMGSSGKALRLECGSAAVEAAPQPAGRPLVIDTEQARLTVLGTRFRLYVGQGDSRVELEEGKVHFERRSDGTSVEVGPGQYAVAANEKRASRPPEVRLLSGDWRLRQTLPRAGGQVAFSHDGGQLATSHGDGVRVWEVATGELRQAARDVGAFARLAFTPSNDAIVALRNDGHVAYWSMGEEGLQLKKLASPVQRLRLCGVSRDGRRLAQTSSDDADGTTIIWDALSGEELGRHRFPAELAVLAVSDDGRILCGYGARTGLVAVDTVSGRQTNLWPGDSVKVHAVRLSRDGRELFAAMADGLVRAWSTESGDATFALATGDVTVTALDVLADGRWLATCGPRGYVKIWQRAEDVREFAP